MLDFIAFFSMLGGVALLFLLCRIDLKRKNLPNEMVLGLGIVGFVFHMTTLFYFNDILDMVAGMIIGGGILYLVREGANKYYGEEALGLSDVKLMIAAGVWLGPEHVLIGMTLGALVGFGHGVFLAFRTMYFTKIKMDISKLAIPAGPGFAIGIFLAALYKFWTFPLFSLFTAQ